MIYNATLVRLDPPEPGSPGPDVSVRCALAPLTVRQADRSVRSGWNATRVAYVPARGVRSPGPVVGGDALLRADGEDNPAAYPIVHVVEQPGQTLGHVQLFLAAPK